VAKAAIEAQTGTQGKDIVKVMELDMSTFEGTKSFTDRVQQDVHTINYVLLNAGLLNTTFKLGEEGFEETIQVNVLSTALLALLLLPWLERAGKGKAHLGLVTSGLHRGVKIDEETFPKKNVLEFFKTAENYPKDMYATSKLFAEYVALEVARLACDHDGRYVVRIKNELHRRLRTSYLALRSLSTLCVQVDDSKPGNRCID
jgi:NAD(P)-dependent dehydrogenase (short-subunit alcohol dehydrogenase family)